MNMFLSLCVLVCLASFLIAGIVGVLAVFLAIQLVRIFRMEKIVGRTPLLLFLLRIFPAALALGTALGFVLPAFLLLEPRHTAETPGIALLLPAMAATVLLGICSARGARLLRETHRASRSWLKSAKRMLVPGSSYPVCCVPGASSLIAVTGLVHPQVFVGERALEALSGKELKAAIAHEVAHIRSFDNLKQFILRITAFPTWLRPLSTLEVAWMQASEFAADDAALRNGASALDLASALVKIGTLKRVTTANPSVAASHLIPPQCESAIPLRAERLRQALITHECSSQPPACAPNGLMALSLATALYLLVLPRVLPVIHSAIEWLVA
jgi:Zn-dependent protease with chaperone function